MHHSTTGGDDYYYRRISTRKRICMRRLNQRSDQRFVLPDELSANLASPTSDQRYTEGKSQNNLMICWWQVVKQHIRLSLSYDESKHWPTLHACSWTSEIVRNKVKIQLTKADLPYARWLRAPLTEAANRQTDRLTADTQNCWLLTAGRQTDKQLLIVPSVQLIYCLYISASLGMGSVGLYIVDIQ